jgi:hypothetical protein
MLIFIDYLAKLSSIPFFFDMDIIFKKDLGIIHMVPNCFGCFSHLLIPNPIIPLIQKIISSSFTHNPTLLNIEIIVPF